MTKQTMAVASMALAATLAGGIWVGRALATGAPKQAPLTYAGTLTDQDGKPYATAQDVTLKLYDAASGGTLKCTASTVQAQANTGDFQVTLPPDCVQAVRDQSELWTELTVGAGKTVLARTKVGAVPYALEADSAKVAGSAAAASGALKTQVDGLQAKVDGLGAGNAGSGPSIVDATGVKLGKLVGAEANGVLHILTNTGYLLMTNSMGGWPSPGNTANFWYSEANCKGDMLTAFTGFSAYLNVIALPYEDLYGAGYLVPSAPKGTPVTYSQKFYYKSGYFSGNCVPAEAGGPGYVSGGLLVKPVAGSVVGLPTKLVGPFGLEP